MTEAMTLNMSQFDVLTFEEMMAIDGGIDWQAIGAGLGILSATMLAVACAPASAFVGVAYVALMIGGAAGGAAAGCYIGYGLAS